MTTFYLILIIVLFLLAISDLVVGVSNDAVNFLNSAVGSRAATFKTIMIVAALGVLCGATFSSGMMEVARKGIFHPQLFSFSEIIILFLAVMITDVILLDTFNTFGMPTSTTVSIVFELLGAATALSIIKIFTQVDALSFWEYINSAKALAIISGILLSVVIAFTSGFIVQWLTRLSFSFDYGKRMKRFGGLWGGLAITAITYFILIKGAKGASFMTSDLKASILENSFNIIAICFVCWTILFTLLSSFTKFNLLKFVVLVGTFALAMAFAGNDLVNFIGVPLAGYNSYQLWLEAGAASPDGFMMEGLAGKVPTPTLLLLLSGLIMVITLLTSKKARTVVQTSLDLGRQEEGSERFSSYLFSRSLVRRTSRFSGILSKALPAGFINTVNEQFDDTTFRKQQVDLEDEAPSFDMVRASTTLVVASILIAIGTTMKLPLSTTYVTFMVFMGTSLADGAWGRESAVYRVSGVLSVIGGWFFTAFSAFTAALILATIIYYGGIYAVIGLILIATFVIYRTHSLHHKRLEEQIDFEKSIREGILTKEKIMSMSAKDVSEQLHSYDRILEMTMDGLASENLNELSLCYKKIKKAESQSERTKSVLNQKMDKLADSDLEAAHFYFLVTDYLNEMVHHTADIIRAAEGHVDNHHKPLLPDQITELLDARKLLSAHFKSIKSLFESQDSEELEEVKTHLDKFVKLFRLNRKKQIKRIKNREVGTRNSAFYFHLLGELRNISLYANRLVNIIDELIINSTESEEDEE